MWDRDANWEQCPARDYLAEEESDNQQGETSGLAEFSENTIEVAVDFERRQKQPLGQNRLLQELTCQTHRRNRKRNYRKPVFEDET